MNLSQSVSRNCGQASSWLRSSGKSNVVTTASWSEPWPSVVWHLVTEFSNSSETNTRSRVDQVL
jgi:hypothetical protein